MSLRNAFLFSIAALSGVLGASRSYGQVWQELPEVDYIDSVSHDGRAATGVMDVGGNDRMFRFTPEEGVVHLGTLPGGSVSVGAGISGDGAVIAGTADDGVNDRAVRWTEGGFLDLGDLGFPISVSTGTNADGSVIVGAAGVNAVDVHAFRWTDATGMVDLGALGGGTLTFAAATSDDGEVVLGLGEDAFGDFRTFVWTEDDGLIDLGALGGTVSFPGAISADGSTAVGYASDAALVGRPYRWTSSGGMEDLGSLGGSEGIASAVSTNGSVIVGYHQNAGGNYRAFRWTEDDGMVDLGTFGGDESYPNAMSGSGSYVVGTADHGDGTSEAFLWRTVHDKMRLADVIEASLGIDMTGYEINSCSGISRDGRRMYVNVTKPDATNGNFYLELAPLTNFSDESWSAPYASEQTYAAFVYAYYGAVGNPNSTELFYSYLFAYYAYLYDQQCDTFDADYYDADELEGEYLTNRYYQYLMQYYAFLYGYYFGGQQGQPMVYESTTASYYSMLYLNYEFE